MESVFICKSAISNDFGRGLAMAISGRSYWTCFSCFWYFRYFSCFLSMRFACGCKLVWAINICMFWSLADLITGYFGLWTVCKDLSSQRSFCGLNVTAFHLTSNFHFCWFVSYLVLFSHTTFPLPSQPSSQFPWYLSNQVDYRADNLVDPKLITSRVFLRPFFFVGLKFRLSTWSWNWNQFRVSQLISWVNCGASLFSSWIWSGLWSCLWSRWFLSFLLFLICYSLYSNFEF